MLSHLRFHRRAPSNPTSPTPDQLSWESAAIHEHPQTTQDIPPLPESRPRSSNAASAPPTLPPIARVTSEPETNFERGELASPPQAQRETKLPPLSRPPYNSSDSGFIGGVALQNYRRGLQNGQHGQHGNPAPAPAAPPVPLPESALHRAKPPPPPIITGLADRPPAVPLKQAKASSFIAPTDLQSSSTTTGKRPAGTRFATDPAQLPQAQAAADTQKTKKGLPFLKNPMSTLLMRRRTGQNAPEPMPQPLALGKTEPAQDFRIRGTKVHDFSAPRQRRIVPTNQHPQRVAASRPDAATEVQNLPQTRPQDFRDLHGYFQNVPGRQSSQQYPSSTPAPAPAPTPARNDTADADNTQTQTSSETQPGPEKRERKVFLDKKPLPEQPVPPVPPKDDAAQPTRTSSTRSKRMPSDGTNHSDSWMPRSTPSTKASMASMSRNVSMSGLSAKDGVIPALPRHMKSTSSRFSFDMIGAAKAEKLLEERHRQRELEKKAVEPELTIRDSRFDDLDDFDYDAMMDDDGLEERIPGVNADAEVDDFYGDDYPVEEEIPMVGDDTIDGIEEDTATVDPDNDQENFSGFVFQRSNPTSSLTSPHTPGMLSTPRDEGGKVIGFAMTKDTTTPDLGQQTSSASPIYLTHSGAEVKLSEPFAGLGIQRLDCGQLQTGALDPNAAEVLKQSQNQELLRHSTDGLALPLRKSGDELYFDGGMVDEFADELAFGGAGADAGAGNGDEPFDESIFDEDDTDQYGRPIPGAFAQAKARRAAEREATEKEAAEREAAEKEIAEREAAGTRRQSDMASSRMSGQSMLSQSTAHTSISVEPPLARPGSEKTTDKEEGDDAAAADRLSGDIQKMLQVSDQDVLYQAALAEATRKAAASGKFRRDSSPPPVPADVTITSPTTASDAPLSGRSVPEPYMDDYNDYDDDLFTQDMDDYDLDDDDIVAEANASALANDSDGFYGQEFGFYSMAPQPNQGHGHHPPSSLPSSGSAALNAQNLFEYSHGGYFGPSGGVGRRTSGRVVSKEPNLTPITERSEYSNRNSIMSLGLPSAVGSGPDRGLQSPGLAQLAMMADDGDMTLSALLRLRSKAWGGSQASLVSSSREGSPRSASAAPQQQAFDGGAARDGASSPWMVPHSAGPPFLGVAHGRKNSAFSVWSNSDAGSGSGSPTMTMNMVLPGPCSAVSPTPLTQSHNGSSQSQSHSASSQSIASPPQHIAHIMSSAPSSSLGITPLHRATPPEDDTPTDKTSAEKTGRSGSLPGSMVWMRSPSIDENLSAFKANHAAGDANMSPPTMAAPQPPAVASRRPGMGHRHKGSADSISYTKEEESGETRWIVERRRAAEDGEVSLEREVIEAGRI